MSHSTPAAGGTLDSMAFSPMRWEGDELLMLDQRVLPRKEEWLRLVTWQEVAAAIRDMAVRGAPAIGIAAGYGLALAALKGDDLQYAADGIAASRPTAVNLFWAIERVMGGSDGSLASVLAIAQTIEREDVECNHAIGRHGATLIPRGARILTVCNTGSLATGGHGTALGVIRSAYALDPGLFVYSCETRPRQQGLRLTAWELMRDGIPFSSIADGAAGWAMRSGRVDLVIAGADRIAANGDTANKIGTYGLACLAERHGLPFYVAAPTSTLDTSLPDGTGIPIEERAAEEVTHIDGAAVAPDGCPVWNPAFDVTPGELISAIITETGVHRPPYRFGL